MKTNQFLTCRLAGRMAVVLLFASIWVAIDYQYRIIDWVQVNVPLHGSLLALAALADMLLIFLLLTMGAQRFYGAETDGGCFQTFRGRRNGGASLGTAVRNWIGHMEQVGKKHR